MKVTASFNPSVTDGNRIPVELQHSEKKHFKNTTYKYKK